MYLYYLHEQEQLLSTYPWQREPAKQLTLVSACAVLCLEALPARSVERVHPDCLHPQQGYASTPSTGPRMARLVSCRHAGACSLCNGGLQKALTEATAGACCMCGVCWHRNVHCSHWQECVASVLNMSQRL